MNLRFFLIIATAGVMLVEGCDTERVWKPSVQLELPRLIVPWDTLNVRAFEDSTWSRRVQLSPREHGIILINQIGPLKNDQRPLYSYLHGQASASDHRPCLFYLRSAGVSFLNCLVTYAYADTFRYPSTHYDTDGGVLHQDLTFVPATITLKYYNRDTILDNRFPEWRKTCEMNRDTMRWIFENWWQRLQQLTGDEQPFIWYRRYDIPSFGSPSYANMIGEWHFSSSDQCIEAQLACLPSMSSRFYRRETEYGGVWVWDPATESYKVDTTVRHDDSLFMAKYGRHKDTGDEIIYDYDWEDLAIYVKITIGRLQLAGWHVTRSAPNFNCRSTVALPDWLSQ